jgi:hypothetical protein
MDGVVGFFQKLLVMNRASRTTIPCTHCLLKIGGAGQLFQLFFIILMLGHVHNSNLGVG